MKVFFDKNKNEWREPLNEEEDKQSLYLDGYLKQILDDVKMLKEKKWDCVFVIVGDEGSGKSTLSFICGQYLSNMGLTMENIAEGSKDALDKLQKLPDGSVIIVDEGELLFSSRETMSKEQRQLTQVMKIIRQKSMVFILVSPVFFDLSKYICVDRSKFLLRTTTDTKLNRGYWQYWGVTRKKKLYRNGKKNYGSYINPKPSRVGRFTNYKLPFDEQYQELKLRSLKEAFEGKKTKEKRDRNMEYKVIAALMNNPSASYGEIANNCNCHPSYVGEIKRKIDNFMVV